MKHHRWCPAKFLRHFRYSETFCHLPPYWFDCPRRVNHRCSTSSWSLENHIGSKSCRMIDNGTSTVLSAGCPGLLIRRSKVVYDQPLSYVLVYERNNDVLHVSTFMTRSMLYFMSYNDEIMGQSIEQHAAVCRSHCVLLLHYFFASFSRGFLSCWAGSRALSLRIICLLLLLGITSTKSTRAYVHATLCYFLTI